MDYYEPPQVEHVYVVNEDQVRNEVRSAYRDVVKASDSKQRCGNGRSCCGVAEKPDLKYAKELGYTEEEFAAVPEGTNMGLGCGNPQAIASLKQGEIVLDLGAGGGFDVFLASRKVGKAGKVYGVDMTPEMLSMARKSAEKEGYHNVEFLLGEIEHLPLPNNTVDVVISNCVVNLSTDKPQVFREAFRVLKDGGRVAISDVVASKPIPKEMVENADLFCNCISGALTINHLKGIMNQAGFVDVKIEVEEESRMFIKDWVPNSDAENYVVSAKITATKPKGRR